MALTSTINIDLGSGTVNLIALVDGNSVELITYDNSTKLVTFDPRDDIIINFSEFLSYCDQINIFQEAIVFNYSPNIASKPFTQIIANELHDPGMWNLTVSAHTDPNVVEYQGTKSSVKMEMLPRASSKTLTFPEWVYFLDVLNHYKTSIKNF
jgi:hypothetical protein